MRPSWNEGTGTTPARLSGGGDVYATLARTADSGRWLWRAVLRRSPGSVLVSVLSLTLGIGATSAIFSVIYGVLIAPYPYARPGEIWAPEISAIDGRGGRAYASTNCADYRSYRHSRP